uniref:EVA1 domain-containing protein n=1 Tax=Neogobius melanostomus TaxID=47308 RepID=A0A8C6TKD7_9GOBI
LKKIRNQALKLFLTSNPESLALFFMMGVCLGLFAALCFLVTGITCRRRRLHRRRKPASAAPPSPERRQLRESSEEDEEAAGSGQSNAALHRGVSVEDVFSSEQELEKARRLEERERILREIWRNGQPDVLATGTGTIGRVHYH